MRVVTGQEMLAIDQHSIAAGMPKAALMEAAGEAVARAACSLLGGTVAGKRVHLLCGTGSNGGDGFVAARRLMNAGARVQVHLVGDPSRMQGEVLQFFNLIQQMGCHISPVLTVNERVRFALAWADLVIDALLGTGAQGAPRSPMAELIAAVNELRRPVLAVDIPTGVAADTGAVAGVAMRAQRTVTMGLMKLGLLLYPGAAYAGKVSVEDIGFPAAHLQWSDSHWPERLLLTAELVRRWGGPRRPDTHKGDYGRVLVIGGSAGMSGAGALTTLAALRTGAGLATWAGPTSLWPVMAAKVTEATTLGLPEVEPGALQPEAVPVILSHTGGGSVLAIGPGLGRRRDTVQTVVEVLRAVEGPVVIDADALYALAEAPELSATPHPNWVITPHPGEAARLLGTSVAAVESDRPAAVAALASMYRCTAVLKGVPTLVQIPDGPLYINSTGNAGMATGGSGDCLTGVIAGLLAQGHPPERAAAAGVYVHGLAGDVAARAGQAGMIAGDMLAALPGVLADLWEREGGDPR